VFFEALLLLRLMNWVARCIHIAGPSFLFPPSLKRDGGTGRALTGGGR